MRIPFLFFSAALILLWSGCNKDDDDLSVIPSVTITGINKTSIVQGNVDAPMDTLIIDFVVSDGNGDFGLLGPLNNVFLTDSRNGSISQFGLYQSAGSSPQIDVPFTLRIPNRPFNICCIYDDDMDDCLPNPNVPTNTVVYTLQVRDFAGNVSSGVDTEPITILCE